MSPSSSSALATVHEVSETSANGFSIEDSEVGAAVGTDSEVGAPVGGHGLIPPDFIPSASDDHLPVGHSSEGLVHAAAGNLIGGVELGGAAAPSRSQSFLPGFISRALTFGEENPLFAAMRARKDAADKRNAAILSGEVTMSDEQEKLLREEERQAAKWLREVQSAEAKKAKAGKKRRASVTPALDLEHLKQQELQKQEAKRTAATGDATADKQSSRIGLLGAIFAAKLKPTEDSKVAHELQRTIAAAVVAARDAGLRPSFVHRVLVNAFDTHVGTLEVIAVIKLQQWARGFIARRGQLDRLIQDTQALPSSLRDFSAPRFSLAACLQPLVFEHSRFEFGGEALQPLKISGPPEVFAMVEHILVGARDEHSLAAAAAARSFEFLLGSLSPLAAILPLPDAERDARGIPASAEYSAFLHPVSELEELTPEQFLRVASLDARAHLLVFGGFVYLDMEHRVVGTWERGRACRRPDGS